MEWASRMLPGKRTSQPESQVPSARDASFREGCQASLRSYRLDGSEREMPQNGESTLVPTGVPRSSRRISAPSATEQCAAQSRQSVGSGFGFSAALGRRESRRRSEQGSFGQRKQAGEELDSSCERQQVRRVSSPTKRRISIGCIVAGLTLPQRQCGRVEPSPVPGPAPAATE